MTDAFDKYMEAARRRRARRPVATKIRFLKSRISITSRGRVIAAFFHKDSNASGNMMAFLRGYDPQLAARMDRRDHTAALITKLVGEDQ